MRRWLQFIWLLLAASAFANAPEPRFVFQFDAANRLTNTITPLNRQTKVSFDNRGLLKTVTEPSGQGATNYYDAKGRLTNRVDGVASTVYSYDANNNLTSVTNVGQASSLSQTCDAYDRMQSYKDADGNLIQYKYDANGNMTNLIYPGGKMVAYFYDSLNRLTNVTDWANRKTAFTYDLASRMTSITRPNGTERIINYDVAGQTTNIIEKLANGAPIAFFKLKHNDAARVDWEFAAPLPHAYTPPARTNEFDDDNRLQKFNGQWVTNDLDGNMTYGPLTNSTLTSYTYDSRNRLLSAGGLSYAYDPSGNRTAITNGTTTTKLVINPNAALSQVLRRIKGSVTNYYIYGAGLLYEVTETATVTNTLTYHYDYRGSTVALTDSNGNVTDRIEYSAYATTTYRTGTNDTPFLYNGRYGVQTDANGLLYMRARYYNPYVCRFLNADPRGFSGGLNFYAYADGNPISMIDPFGLGSREPGGLSSWLNYNTIATAIIPGQAAWNNAVSSFQNGNYGSAALGVATMLGQDVLFALTFGESQAATPAFGAVSQVENATANSGVRLASGAQQTLAGTQNGVLLGTLENGQVNLFQAAAGQIEGHADLLNAGLVSPGAQGFSIGVQSGQVTTIFQNSILNPASANYLLPAQTTQQILNALGATGARLFP
jgi:RHS repeat-associated protein